MEHKVSYKIQGMTCTSCALSLEGGLKFVHGIEKVSVNYPNERLSLVYDTDKINEDKIKFLIEEIGYKVAPDASNNTDENFLKHENRRLKGLKRKLFFSFSFSLPVFIISMFFMDLLPYTDWVLFWLSLPVIIYSGGEFYKSAWKKLRRLNFNMDSLVSMSTGVAFIYSVFNTVFKDFLESIGMTVHVYYDSAVVIISLILLGRFWEERAKAKSSFAIRQLMALQPNTLSVIRNGEEIALPLNEVIVGDLVVVKPGERIPVDGKVKRGESYIDESMISGETFPVHKVKGDKVFTGTINQKGSLRILTKNIGKNTMLSQIIKLVEQAQGSKPEIQKLVDKIAGVFVPIVLVASLLTLIGWIVFGPGLVYAVSPMIAVLIISCPCALGLATPTALMVGIGRGAQYGVLVKDAQTLLNMSKVDTLVFDKTGTLTVGNPSLTDSYWVENEDVEYLSKVLLSMEQQSEHPIAEALVKALKLKHINPITLSYFESNTGKGISANVGEVNYYVGNEKLMLEKGVIIENAIRELANKWKKEAKTVVLYAKENRTIGVFSIADELKDNAIIAVNELKRNGLDLHLLTGDNNENAKVVAQKLGIKNYTSEVLPHEKGELITSLQKQGKVVAMIGDGINDAQALAQADVGIAMGTGTDVALESAGITLLHADISKIPSVIRLAAATNTTIKQNLFWAFIYNIIAIPIAAGIFFPINGFMLSPMVAGAAMSMSSLSVMFNSLLLKKKKI